MQQQQHALVHTSSMCNTARLVLLIAYAHLRMDVTHVFLDIRCSEILVYNVHNLQVYTVHVLDVALELKVRFQAALTAIRLQIIIHSCSREDAFKVPDVFKSILTDSAFIVKANSIKKIINAFHVMQVAAHVLIVIIVLPVLQVITGKSQIMVYVSHVQLDALLARMIQSALHASIGTTSIMIIAYNVLQIVSYALMDLPAQNVVQEYSYQIYAQTVLILLMVVQLDAWHANNLTIL